MSYFTEAVRWLCRGCRGLYAAGAPCCPECRGTVYEEEAGVAKITKWAGEPELAQEAVPAEAEAAAEPPDPTQDPGPGQGSTPPPSSPGSSGDVPEAAAEAEAPAAAKPKPSLSGLAKSN